MEQDSEQTMHQRRRDDVRMKIKESRFARTIIRCLSVPNVISFPPCFLSLSLSLSLFSLTRVCVYRSKHTLSLLLTFPSERGCFEENRSSVENVYDAFVPRSYEDEQ